MELLRIATAGSVDDGKSTLIGRLLYDTNSLSGDKIQAATDASRKRGLSELDHALFTDGLLAEREQGITIDVAHLYFNTPRRKYIVADSPGHFEYTRNMLTAASSADLSIILIDASRDFTDQSRRHFYLTNMVGVKRVIFALNKMDLVDYSEEKYYEFCAELKRWVDGLGEKAPEVTFIPISAKQGDNVVERSENTPWYDGPALLEALEEIPVEGEVAENAVLEVQTVIRPKEGEWAEFRGFTAKVRSGKVKVGDEIHVYPGGLSTKVTAIRQYKSELEEAVTGQSVVLELADEVGAPRGSIFSTAPLEGKKALSAKLCWMDSTPLNLAGKYIIQAGARETQVKVSAINGLLNPQKLQREGFTKDSVQLNDIFWADLKLASPFYIESHVDNPGNGAFILVDPRTKNTVAVGLVE